MTPLLPDSRRHAGSRRGSLLTMSLRARIAMAVSVVVGVLLAMATPAFAHPYLLNSSPAVNAVVTASPDKIDISYTEGLDLPYCKVSLVGPSGQEISTTVTHGAASNDLVATLDSPLTQAGTYAVEWTAVGEDGHTVIGDYAVSLNHTSRNSEVTAGATPSSGSSSELNVEWFLRVLLPAGTVLFTAVLLLGTAMAGVIGRARSERRDLVGRRFVRLRALSAGALGAIVIALSLQSITSGGFTAFGQSGLGRRLLAELVVLALALPLLADGGALRSGRPVARLRQLWSWAVAVGLIVVLATSSHALTQPNSRRGVALFVYAVHLCSVSVWLGALLAVTVPLGRGVWNLTDDLIRLRRLVTVTIVAVLVTGVLNTDWAVRSLGQVVHSSYGSVVIAKVALYLVVITLGVTATVLLHRRSTTTVAAGEDGAVSSGSRSKVLLGLELGLVAVTLVLAGILGELPQPLDFPLASQTYATSVGLPTSVAESGHDTAVGVVSPGLVGPNRLVVRLAKADINQFLQPVDGVTSVQAKVVCGCQSNAKTVTLTRQAGGPWWSANVNLPTSATWSFSVRFQMTAGHSDPQATLSTQIEPPSLPAQVVVGVAADLSGASGEQCQNQTLGLQTAFADVNNQGVDHGDLVRVVPFDVHDGVQPAMQRLLALHPSVLALPCGTPAQVAQITQDARNAHVPVIESSVTTAQKGVWSLGPDWQEEGSLIAEQAHVQGAATVSVIAGSTATDRLELKGFSSAAKKFGIVENVSSLPANAPDFIFSLAASNPDGIVILANPTEAAPVTQALSTLNVETNWVPSRGILTSSQLMNTDYINDAGQITRVGELEIASTIDPFDSVDMYYAQRLRALTPGLLPSFDGVAGYNAGLTITSAFRLGGGHPSASMLLHIFSTKFKNFVSGSYHASWGADGGHSAQLSFFRPTYVNPLALPANTPAGAQAMTHEGTFLDSGGFEQVAPFREMK